MTSDYLCLHGRCTRAIGHEGDHAVTSPAGNTEPTAEQYKVGMELAQDILFGPDQDVAAIVARALAAAITAERDKYLRVAEKLEAEGRRLEPVAYNDDLIDAARRIREVAG